ncbi:hypothetical protein ACSVC9_11535 [Clostridium sp. LBM24168]
MSKHHHRNNNNGFNLGDLLSNIDIPQLLSMLSSFSGSKGMASNDKISSILNNLNMEDIASNSRNGFDDSNIKSKLAALENRLSSLENRNQMQNEVLQKVRELQNSPDAAKFLNDFMNSNLDDHKRNR